MSCKYPGLVYCGHGGHGHGGHGHGGYGQARIGTKLWSPKGSSVDAA